GAFSVEKAEEAVRGLINTATSEEDRETFIQTMNNQLEAFGDGIQQARDENGELKNELEFSDGTTNTWLDGINKIIEDLNLSMKITKDKNGELQLVIKNEAGETILISKAGQRDELNEKGDKGEEKVDNFVNKERKPIELEIDDEDFNKPVDEN